MDYSIKIFSGKIKTSSTSTIRHAVRYALQIGWMDYKTANEQVIGYLHGMDIII
ncbi:hypothetical protein G8C41_00285 [Apibacter sp. B3706]|uniref:hypothetical protein n=1 Tax=unclassified Apibacter TaxID=2630820 RepID=UPI0013706C72|nr:MULTISPECIES: hypothetical protein [unclassified Apibacter]QII69322.1 hypothetical protein G8C41_00285 [Apibacter sp. B3706]